MVGYKNQVRWKRVPITKQVPYKSTKTISVEVPIYKEVKVISGYKAVTENVPRFEQKQVLAGYKTITETIPVFEDRQVQVGTKIVTREMPQYETVRVVAGYDEIPKHQTASLDVVDQKIKKLCDEDERLKELLVDREFEVSDVVYLKGGPGAGYGIEKVENSYSGYTGGGGGASTPGMLLFKLISRVLVLVRDTTNILQGPSYKPDAQAIIMYSDVPDGQKIDDIVVINKGNETLTIEGINIGSNIENSHQMKEYEEIYPKFQTGTDIFDKIRIESGSFRAIPVDPDYKIIPNTLNTIYIKLVSNSKRSGFLIHEFHKQD